MTFDDELTTLRRRLDDLEKEIERKSFLRTGRNRIGLFQVYNAGAIPSGSLKFYATHPVKIAATESESSTWSVTAGTSTTNVIVLGDTPSVGDVFIARQNGGYWIAEKRAIGGGTPPCGEICFHVRGCFATGVSSASVAVSQSGTPIAGSPLTTDASGNVCFDISSAGTYDYSVSHTGFVTATGSISALCTTNNRQVDLTPDTGRTCCGNSPVAMPDTLYLSDSFGSATLIKVVSTSGRCEWQATVYPAGPTCAVDNTSPFFVTYILAYDFGITGWYLQVRWSQCLNYGAGTDGWGNGGGRPSQTAIKPFPVSPISLSFDYLVDFPLGPISPSTVLPPFGTITITE